MKTIKVLQTPNGGIRINFMLEGTRYTLSPVKDGRFTNPADYGHAYSVAHTISTDISAGIFDRTLEKYKPASTATLKAIAAQKDFLLYDLWAKYVNNKSGQVSKTTLVKTYGLVSSALEVCPYKRLDQSIDIKNWLLTNKSPIVCQRVLMHINACCKTMVNDGVISANPFMGYRQSLNKKTSYSESDINPFSEKEKEAIIRGFTCFPRYSHFRYLVQFLFSAGCRPSEAIALTWADVKNDKVVFNKALVNGHLNKTLKTQGQRIIAQNSKIKLILEAQKEYVNSKDFSEKKLVFPSTKGNGAINWTYFSNRVWVNVLGTLPDVSYRNPYQMRHTFITQALKQATPQDVARHCGNSPEVIFKHYAGVSRDFVMPEI